MWLCKYQKRQALDNWTWFWHRASSMNQSCRNLIRGKGNKSWVDKVPGCTFIEVYHRHGDTAQWDRFWSFSPKQKLQRETDSVRERGQEQKTLHRPKRQQLWEFQLKLGQVKSYLTESKFKCDIIRTLNVTNICIFQSRQSLWINKEYFLFLNRTLPKYPHLPMHYTYRHTLMQSLM